MIKDIKELSNDEIVEAIVELNKKQLELIKESSYLNIFNGINKLKESISTEEKIKEEEQLFTHYIDKAMDYIKASIVKDYNKDEKLQELVNIREEIYDISSIIEGYNIELSYAGQMIDQYGVKLLSKKDYKNTTYNAKKIDDLLALINDQLFKSKDNYSRYMNIVSQIITMLPMRLTKDNYFSIIRETLIRNLKTKTQIQVEHQINEYKKEFDSSLKDGYGTKFDYYFTEIQKLKTIDLENKSIDELDELVKNIIEITKEIDTIFDFIINLGLIYNLIIVVNLCDDIYVYNSIEEIYVEWIKDLDDNKKTLIESKIDKRIKEIEKKMLEDLEGFNALNTEAIARENFESNELNTILLNTRKILTYYNDSQLIRHSLLINEDNELVSEEYLNQSIDTLVQYITRSIIDMKNAERKLRMKNLLSIIELPFKGIDEFNNYIRYSLDNKVLNVEEINFNIDYILYFIEGLEK